METWFIEGYDTYNIYNYCCVKAKSQADAIVNASIAFNIVKIEKVYRGR